MQKEQLSSIDWKKEKVITQTKMKLQLLAEKIEFL